MFLGMKNDIWVRAAGGGYRCLCGVGVLRFGAREIAKLGEIFECASGVFVEGVAGWREEVDSRALARTGAGICTCSMTAEAKKACGRWSGCAGCLRGQEWIARR